MHQTNTVKNEIEGKKNFKKAFCNSFRCLFLKKVSLISLITR